MTRKEKVKGAVASALFIAGFLFIGSGMFEAILLRLLDIIGF